MPFHLCCCIYAVSDILVFVLSAISYCFKKRWSKMKATELSRSWGTWESRNLPMLIMFAGSRLKSQDGGHNQNITKHIRGRTWVHRCGCCLDVFNLLAYVPLWDLLLTCDWSFWKEKVDQISLAWSREIMLIPPWILVCSLYTGTS